MWIEVTVLHKLVRITGINNEKISGNEIWIQTCNCRLYLTFLWLLLKYAGCLHERLLNSHYILRLIQVK